MVAYSPLKEGRPLSEELYIISLTNDLLTMKCGNRGLVRYKVHQHSHEPIHGRPPRVLLVDPLSLTHYGL